jgi:hypothetical protein
VIRLLEFKQQPNNQVVQKYVIFFNYFSSSNKTDVLILMGKNMSQFSIAFPNATVGNNFTIFSFAVSKLLDLTVFNEMINRSHYCKFSIANNHAHKYFFSCRKKRNPAFTFFIIILSVLFTFCRVYFQQVKNGLLKNI